MSFCLSRSGTILSIPKRITTLILLSIPKSILLPLYFYSIALSIPKRPPLLPLPRYTNLSILRIRPESCRYSPFLRASRLLYSPLATYSDHLTVDLHCTPHLTSTGQICGLHHMSTSATQLRDLADELQAFINSRHSYTDEIDLATHWLIE